MIRIDEDALICDFAETYQIYNYKGLRASYAATLAVGLRDNSRIKLKMKDDRYDMETYLLAQIVDALYLGIWANQGGKGEKPKSLVMALAKSTETKKEEMSFSNGEDFMKYRQSLVSRCNNG